MPELKTRILIVDDDQRHRDLLVKYLGGEGYDVKAVPDAGGMDKQLARDRYDLVVLDLMLPGEDGLSICRRLRAQQSAPAIIMLTAKGDDVDRIVGLEMGADDYVVKPFSPRELIARVGSVLRRVRTPAPGEVLSIDGLEIDGRTREVRRDGQPVTLTRREFDLLAFLARTPRQVFTRAQLLEQVWDSSPDWQDPATVTVHIGHLRQHNTGFNLFGCGWQARYIITDLVKNFQNNGLFSFQAGMESYRNREQVSAGVHPQFGIKIGVELDFGLRLFDLSCKRHILRRSRRKGCGEGSGIRIVMNRIEVPLSLNRCFYRYFKHLSGSDRLRQFRNLVLYRVEQLSIKQKRG